MSGLQKLGMILENKMSENSSYQKNVNNKNCSSRANFINDDDFIRVKSLK